MSASVVTGTTNQMTLLEGKAYLSLHVKSVSLSIHPVLKHHIHRALVKPTGTNLQPTPRIRVP